MVGADAGGREADRSLIECVEPSGARARPCSAPSSMRTSGLIQPALIAGVGLLVMIAMLTSCAGLAGGA